MHPAPSVIVFTTLSGFGFGVLAWLGLGVPDVTGGAAFGLYFLGFAAAVGGLLASVTHLANPKNAIKAFSQWQSSWLSREGVLAIAALLVVALAALGRVFFGGAPILLGGLGTVLCLATVFSTSMIYTQLKTVPRWHHPLTPALFLGYAVAGGALITGHGGLAAVLLAVLGILQVVAWAIGDGAFARGGTSLESATGLGTFGVVTQLEPPHSGSNYLLKEMGYQVGRKHAEKLRWIGAVLAFALPVLMALVFGLSGFGGAMAVVVHLVGVTAIRWVFFAEAQHVVSLYYGHPAGGPVTR